MRYKFFIFGLLAAITYLFWCGPVAGAAEPELEDTYYTLTNEDRYTLIHEVKLNNYGLTDAYDIKLTLPLMDQVTPAYSRKLREQIVPWPDRIETDERGRRTAYYHLDELPAGAEAVFTQKYVVEMAGIDYDNSIMSGTGGYEDQLESFYLLPSLGIESDHAEIIEFAKKAAGKYTDPYDIAQNAFAAVNLYMTYEQDNLVYGGALLALRRAKGVCEDYSSLYVAVLRSLGIAARQQGGYLYLPDQHNIPPYLDTANERIKLNALRHTWTEFYVPGQGWVIADPTFTYSFDMGGVPTKFPNWDYFASITDDRRYLFFHEGFVKEEKGNLWVGRGGFVESTLINGYLLFGSQAAFYNDLPGHWAESAIMRLADREEPLLQGMGNGMFGVNQPMTRAQLVTCFQRLLKSPPAGPKFTDLKTTHWAYRDIGAAQQAGWIKGYPDGSFRPDRPVTRAELAQMLVEVFQLEPHPPTTEEEQPDTEQEEPETQRKQSALGEHEDQEDREDLEETGDPENTDDMEEPETQNSEPIFADLGLPGYAWADEAITTLALLELTHGSGNGYYEPQRPVTRAEFATFLDRILSLRGL